MDKDVSNKTLATILVVAIIASLSTTLISLQRFGGLTDITGRAQQDLGSTTVTVQESVSIVLTTDTINFGTGYVNGSDSTCVSNGVNLTTMGTGDNDDDCFINASDSAPANQGTDFVLNNDGTVNASVTVISENKTQLFGVSTHSEYNFTFRGQESDTYTCLGTLQDSWIEFDDDSITLCDDFNWSDAADDLTIEVSIAFPSDVYSGTYSNSSIEFNAVQA